MKIALVIHPLLKYGGAEKHLIDSILTDKEFEFEIFTAFYKDSLINEHFPNVKVNTTFFNYLPEAIKCWKPFISIWGLLYRLMKIKSFDKVIVISDGFEKQIRTKESIKTVLYILTPPRFLWMEESRANEKGSELIKSIFYKPFKKILHKFWRYTDLKAVSRYDEILANSETVIKRVKKYYGRDAQLLYPPVEIVDKLKSYSPVESKENYLFIGRLEKYKGVFEVIEAFKELRDRKLKVIGTGSRIDELKQTVKEYENISLEGFVSPKKKIEMLLSSKALIFASSDEDFGIVPVEALAAGLPVISISNGGPTEFLSDKCAVLFDEVEPSLIMEAVKEFESSKFDPVDVKKCSDKFSKEAYQWRFKEILLS